MTDAADPSTGYVPRTCPFPEPHGRLELTNLPRITGFDYVCDTHMDAAIATVAAPTPVGGQGSPRCSGCDFGIPLPGANRFDIAAVYPSRSFGVGEPYVRACAAHAVQALTALLETP